MQSSKSESETMSDRERESRDTEENGGVGEGGEEASLDLTQISQM